MSVFEISSTVNPMSIGLQKCIILLSSETANRFSLYSILCMKKGLFTSFWNLRGHEINSICFLLRIDSIVIPKISEIIKYKIEKKQQKLPNKEIFFKIIFAAFLISVFKTIHFFSHGKCLNFSNLYLIK